MLESLLFLFFFKKINIFSCFKRNVIASLLQENGNLLVKKKCDSSQNFTIRRHVKQLLSLRHHRCILASFRLSMAGIATCYYLTLSSTRDDEDDSVAKMKAAEEALEAKQKVTNSLSATCSFFFI
ncbi:uncharacterized protein [Gossypium hirsutum]|uniref:Uncharacterized protein isoform X1 n=2 Tax=Gossypium TaxID=3633 RepID=A0ABM3AFQ7_GOSHI|nr:uncharacterized protein LOC107953673 isoform X1 [Gossypium hirsutum]